MSTFKKAIYNNIQESDVVLNAVIQDYLDTQYVGSVITVAQWRIDNYEQLRRWSYPPIGDYLDVQVKVNSGIGSLEAEGVRNFKKYTEQSIEVKIRFPKE